MSGRNIRPETQDLFGVVQKLVDRRVDLGLSGKPDPFLLNDSIRINQVVSRRLRFIPLIGDFEVIVGKRPPVQVFFQHELFEFCGVTPRIDAH